MAAYERNSPVVGATKFHHIEDAVKAVELELTEAVMEKHVCRMVERTGSKGGDKQIILFMKHLF